MPTHRKWTFRSVQTPACYRVNCPRLSAHFLVLVAGRCWWDKKKKVPLPLSFALPACAWSKNLSQIAWKFIAFAGVELELFTRNLMNCFEPSLTLRRSWQRRDYSRPEISFPAHRSLLIVFPKYRNQTIHSPSFFSIRSPNNLNQLFLFPFFLSFNRFVPNVFHRQRSKSNWCGCDAWVYHHVAKCMERNERKIAWYTHSILNIFLLLICCTKHSKNTG